MDKLNQISKLTNAIPILPKVIINIISEYLPSDAIAKKIGYLINTLTNTIEKLIFCQKTESVNIIIEKLENLNMSECCDGIKCRNEDYYDETIETSVINLCEICILDAHVEGTLGNYKYTDIYEDWSDNSDDSDDPINLISEEDSQYITPCTPWYISAETRKSILKNLKYRTDFDSCHGYVCYPKKHGNIVEIYEVNMCSQCANALPYDDN
jgi:hypothetical protein